VRDLHDALVVADLDGSVRAASDSVERLCGVRPADAVGRDLSVLLGDEGRTLLVDALARRGRASALDIPLTRSGGAAWLRARANTFRDPTGRPVGIVILLAEVTSRRRGDDIMRALLHSIEHSAVAFILLDEQGLVTYVNRPFCELYGYAAHEMIGKPVQLLSGEEDPAAHYARAFAEASSAGVWRGDDLRRHRDGTIFHASATLSRVPDEGDRLLCFSEASRDIRDRVERVEHLTSISIHDSVTGIYNRRYFNDFLEKAWARAMRERTAVALVIADIDHFKAYNDHYGHVQGDECLGRVAQAMSSAVRRTSDALARYGGEEFAAVLGETDLAGAVHVAEGLRAAVAELALAHECSPVADHVTISVGVAAALPKPSSAGDPDGPIRLLRTADAALYRAKAQGRDRVEAGEPEGRTGAPDEPQLT
jgi:diguanylate cyclase (GGDEF)-like protein/PAS domain S-box-containing protein